MAESGIESVYDAVPLPLGDSVSIRVISIRPRIVSNGSERIACEFHLLDLETKLLRRYNTTSDEQKRVEYTALSYTWGDATPLRSIDLDGIPFTVRENLWNFLNQAREDSFSGYLWIDALCIDQSRVGERNHQVSMMGSIYSKAERVIVWLGFVSERIKLALEETREALSNNKSRGPIWMRHRKGIEEFYNLPYWSRAWIVQEYILAKAIDIWCGQFRLRGDGLAGLCITRKNLFATAEEEHSVAVNTVSRDFPAEGIIEHRERRRLSSRNMEFVTSKVAGMTRLIRGIGRNMQCTYPRDRIYSLPSLLSSEERELFAVTADYSRSTSELFACVYEALRTEWSWDVSWMREDDLHSLQEMLELDDTDPAVRRVWADLRAAHLLSPTFSREHFRKMIAARASGNFLTKD